MKTLKGLTFAAAPIASKSPVLLRRAKLVANLHQQKLLAENPATERLYGRIAHRLAA